MAGSAATKSLTSLARLAVDTGGRYTERTNDLTLAYARAQRDQACLYALGFYVKPTDDRPREVVIRMRPRGLRAIHPSRYLLGEKRREALLLAANAAPEGVDALAGRGALIPLGYEDGAFRALVQFAVPDAEESALAATTKHVWDLGMTRIADGKVAERTDRRVETSRAPGQVVLEAVWSFPPGSGSVVAVGSDPLGERLATARLETEWPDPSGAVSIGALSVAQETDGVFVRGGDGGAARLGGLLEAGDAELDGGRPVEFSALVCRGKRTRENLWVQRRVIGGSPLELDRIVVEDDVTRCLVTRDVVATRRLRPGQHVYEVSVYDNRSLRGEPLARTTREFTIADDLLVAHEAPPAAPPAEPPAPAAPAEPDAPVDDSIPAVTRAPIGPLVEPREPLPPLETILERMAGVASLYLDKALGFSAGERTEVFEYIRGIEHSYVAPEVVYCFYNTGEGHLDDRRIAKSVMSRLKKRLKRGEDIGAELAAAQNPLQGNAAIPSYVLRPYTWIVLFSHAAQKHYLYRVEGAARDGVWISLRPAGAAPQATDWYGDVLVDLDTFQIVRAQGYQQASLDEMRRAEATLRSDEELPPDGRGPVFLETHVRTEFKRSAQGIRLPSRVTLEIYDHVIVQPVARKQHRKRLRYKVVQRFKNYEFYDVRVEDRIAEVAP